MSPFPIFISYRHTDTADKAEHLHSLLEGAGYEGRVSFDRDNLHGRFDLEILRRLDACTDFIIVIGYKTLDSISAEETELYKQLAVCCEEEFPALEAQTIEAKSKRLREQGINVGEDDLHIDFVRLEIARAIARGKNIIPVVPVKTASFDFNTLRLPEDIRLLTKYQAVMYQDSKDFMFKDNLPHILYKLKTKAEIPVSPKPVSNIKWLLIASAILVFAVLIVGLVRWLNEKQRFSSCRTQSQYEEFQKTSWFYAKACSDSVSAFNTLKGDGYAAINDTARNSGDSIFVNWHSDCTLSQLRVLRQIINNMMLVPAGRFTMGTDREEGLGNSPHEVTIKQDFYLSKFELTEREWNAIKNDSPVGSEMLPMTDISWNDCNDFINIISRLTGLTFCLPSEEQWEYAAGFGHPEWMYAGSGKPAEVAVFGIGSKQSVNSKKPNALEIYFLSGNVAEWTRDVVKGRARIRGGSFASREDEVTVTYSDAASPDMGSNYIGMRLMLIKE